MYSREAPELRYMQACLVACTLGATEGLPIALNTFDGPLGTTMVAVTELGRYAVSLHVEGVHRWTLDTADREQARKLAVHAAFGHYDGG